MPAFLEAQFLRCLVGFGGTGPRSGTSTNTHGPRSSLDCHCSDLEGTSSSVAAIRGSLTQGQTSQVVRCCISPSSAVTKWVSRRYELHLGHYSGTPSSKRRIASDHEDST